MMAIATRSLTVAALVMVSGVARAQHSPLPNEIIALDTAEGEKMLAEATAKTDFVRLVSTYTTQERPSFCGVASAVVILNALMIPHPATDLGGLFTQQNVFNDLGKGGITADEASKGGMTLAQLGNLLQTHPTKVELTYASEINVDEMRTRLTRNLATVDDYVIVNYNRGVLGQEAMGHISPLGAYHQGSDRFLVLDVARYKYPPHWIKADALFAAMQSTDLISGKARGYVTVTAATLPPGTKFTANVRRPLMLLSGIIGAALFVGVGIGFFVGRATNRVRPNPALN